jgi:predicted RNA-binding Zn-ribbon protein involved in translation (DUF1610 family)
MTQRWNEMDKDQREAWNNRPVEVTVKEPCPKCGVLHDVKSIMSRTHNSPWVRMMSCKDCFDKAISEAKTKQANTWAPSEGFGCFMRKVLGVL